MNLEGDAVRHGAGHLGAAGVEGDAGKERAGVGLPGSRGRSIRQLARKEAVRIQVGNRSARLLKSE